MKRQIAATGLSIVLLIMLGSCGSKDPNGGQQGKFVPQTSTDAPAGDPSTTSTAAGLQFTAQDLSGRQQSSAQWIGKGPVVLNFWGTWCPPCRREIPDLVRLYAEYHPRGVEIIGLAVKDEPGDVRAYAQRASMKWVLLMANDDVIQAYNIVNGVPTTVFLDKDGREVTRFVGNRTYDDFKPAFEAILQGNR